MKSITTLALLCIISTFAFCDTRSFFKEESPYLKAHFSDSVNWYAWNDKTLKHAQTTNKLIFLSIGYSTCHWCHIMQQESFQNQTIAKLLNKDYISIKVDKEESPHLDSFYQQKLSSLTNSRNGWPLTAIMTPDLKLLYLATYVPPTSSFGLEGLTTLLPKLAIDYKNDRHTILQNKPQQKKKHSGLIEDDFLKQMKKRYDKQFKGFDQQPKFPRANHLSALLDISLLKKDNEAYEMVINTLEVMARSGLNDHVEGAFFRYSVYENWQTPHFEKMLYTQAQLISLYIKAYHLSNKKLFKQTALKTLEATNTYFRAKNHLYFSAIDASSFNQDGTKQEGYYYTYTYDNVFARFKEAKLNNKEELMEYLGFDYFGNFNDQDNHLYLSTLKEPKNLEQALTILKNIRENKAFPFIDKKFITSWNALMIKALFEASSLDSKYLTLAQASLSSLLKKLYINKQLYHQKLPLQKPKKVAYFEDYALLAQALKTAYQFSFENSYLKLSQKLINESYHKFYEQQKWFLDEQKIYPAHFKDKHYASALSSLLNTQYDLALLQEKREQINAAKQAIIEQKESFSQEVTQHPLAIVAKLKAQYGGVVIKSTKKNLLKSKRALTKIKRPFTLLKPNNTENFLACDEKSCFSFDKNLNVVIQAIDK